MEATWSRHAYALERTHRPANRRDYDVGWRAARDYFTEKDYTPHSVLRPQTGSVVSVVRLDPNGKRIAGTTMKIEPIWLSLDDVNQILGWGSMAQIHSSPPQGDLAPRLIALQRSLAEDYDDDPGFTVDG